MSGERNYRGGCLCGEVRYQAKGEPRYAGLCYCCDCRKSSGGGYIGFMGFDASTVELTGETHANSVRAANGNQAVRNFCVRCGSLVFGGRRGVDETYNLYAGSLDDPAQFSPRIAIFTRDRPAWAALPERLVAFEAMPPQG